MSQLKPLERALLAVLATGMAIRGADYLIKIDHPRPLMPRFDPGGWLPPETWGLMCLTVALLVVVGVASNRLKLVAFGCFTSGIVNLMLSIPMFLAVLVPPVDDFRMAADYLVKTAIWWIVAVSVLKKAVIQQAKGG